MNEHIQEALRQVVEGDDFTAPAKLLADLTPEQATTVLVGSVESIASIVWHTLFRVEAWNSASEGDTTRLKWIPNAQTWPVVTTEVWPALHDKFIGAFYFAAACRYCEPRCSRKTGGQNRRPESTTDRGTHLVSSRPDCSDPQKRRNLAANWRRVTGILNAALSYPCDYFASPVW